MKKEQFVVVAIIAISFLSIWGGNYAYSATVDNVVIGPSVSTSSGLGSVMESKSTPPSSSQGRYLNMGPITWDGASADSYLDKNSLVLDRGYIEIVSLKNFPAERMFKSTPYRSETNKINVDCANRRFRILDNAKYSDLFASGALVETNDFALQGYAKWTDVAPNSLMDRILNSSCYLAEKR